MKSNIDSIFKTSESLEKTGVWFMITDKTGFLVKPYGDMNPKTKSALTKHFKPVARKVDMGTLDQKEERKIMVKLFVDICLVDWKGLDLDGVKDLPYDRDKAIQFLFETPTLFKTLMGYAQDYRNYKEDEDSGDEKEVVGNSSSDT